MARRLAHVVREVHARGAGRPRRDRRNELREEHVSARPMVTSADGATSEFSQPAALSE